MNMEHYVLSSHARERMRERGISEEDVRMAIRRPTTTAKHAPNRVLIKTIYTRRGKQRLLLIAGEYIKETLRIITVIDTSKVNKYL